MRQSEKIARTGGWKANPFTDRLYWTEGVYDICEAPKDYQPGLDEGLEFYTLPYRSILKEAIAKTIETRGAIRDRGRDHNHDRQAPLDEYAG